MPPGRPESRRTAERPSEPPLDLLWSPGLDDRWAGEDEYRLEFPHALDVADRGRFLRLLLVLSVLGLMLWIAIGYAVYQVVA
jgi:hypothetical protein